MQTQNFLSQTKVKQACINYAVKTGAIKSMSQLIKLGYIVQAEWDNIEFSYLQEQGK